MKGSTEEEIKAEEFLRKTNTEFKAVFIVHDKYFPDDEEKRDIYEIALRRGNREYKFKFGQSICNSGQWKVWSSPPRIVNGKRPTNTTGCQVERNKDFQEPKPYDVLACVQKYEVGEFNEFCMDFGYDADSIKALGVYEAVKKEFSELQKLFSDAELEEMQGIQ